jgi:hypothetical protein
MEPFTLVAGGLLLYGWLKGKGPTTATPSPAQLAATPSGSTAHLQALGTAQSGTGPDAPLATTTSVVNNIPFAQGASATPVPDLVSVLDNDTAMAMRAYAALNPDDFQVWLNRYADHIQLRDDLFFQAMTDPPTGGYQPTPGMIASMGSAAYKVMQAFNGVAVGKYGDVFGAAASVAGVVPGVDPMLVKSLQGLVLGYRAFTAGVQAMNTIGEIALANGVSAMDVTGSILTGGASGLTTIAAPIASMAGVLMAVGLVVDIGFTIAGNAPDVQKAIDVALDVASLACLFIPVVGWVIAIVIQLVKFIIDLFGGDLFGGGLSHAQREAIETARYGQNLNPMFPELANAFTPRELHRAICNWTTGYCGGIHNIAMGVNLVLKEGDVVHVGGQPYTITAALGTGSPILLPPGATQITLGIVDNGANGHGCYALKGGPFEAMTNDEMAWALGMYATKNGVIAEAQAGIAEALKTQFNDPVQNTIEARAQPMANFLAHGLSLDQIDQVALEYRAQPHLNALATAYGWPDWQHMLADVVHDEWLVFNIITTHGSLHDFALQNGYPTMYAFRAAAFATYESYWERFTNASTALAANLATATGSIYSYVSTVLWMQSNTGAP